MGRELHLYEEIMLLALRDEEGTLAAGTQYSFALGGALLAELLLEGRLRIDESGRRPLVEVASSAALHDDLLDEGLRRIATAGRRATAATWVSRLAGVRRLKHRAAEALCRRGILRASEGKVLLIFSRTTWPTVDPAPEQAILRRLEQAIFTEAPGIAPRTVVLVSLAHAGDLLRTAFGRKRVRERKRRIQEIVHGERMGEATKEAIQAAQAAMMVATVIPGIVAATSVHH